MRQNVFRRIQAEGRLKKPSCSLAFVLMDAVVEYFSDIRDYLPEDLDPVTDYFEVTSIRRMKAKRRREPSSELR